MNETPAAALPVPDPQVESPTAPAPGQLAQNVCPDCGGRGRDATGVTCPGCQGSGDVLETVGDA